MTDRDRLDAWMAAHGYDIESLAKRLYSSQPWRARKMLTGEQPISAMFKFQFGRTFGRDALAEVFGITNLRSKLFNERDWFPEKYEAHSVLARAIKRGLLLPATAYNCCGCNKNATEYHHPSYHSSDHLNVIPMCRTCHRRVHTGKLTLPPLGVVPTQVGLVRIAISHHPS